MSKFSHTFILNSDCNNYRVFSFAVAVPHDDFHYRFLVVPLGDKFCVECYVNPTRIAFNPEFVGVCADSYESLFELIENYL